MCKMSIFEEVSHYFVYFVFPKRATCVAYFKKLSMIIVPLCEPVKITKFCIVQCPSIPANHWKLILIVIEF